MQDYIQFQERRKALIEQVKHEHGISQGVIMLAAAYAPVRHGRFRQESTFYYFTGVQEPACVALIWLTGETHIYVPQYPEHRSKWTIEDITAESSPSAYKVDGVHAAGVRQSGIEVSPLHDASAYSHVIEALRGVQAHGDPICACVPHNQYAHVVQQSFVRKVQQELPDTATWYNIAPCVGRLRPKKSRDEVARIHHAASVTTMAHEAAACAIEAGKPEQYIQAAAEYIFTECGAEPAFPSVVASGSNSTILHYHQNNAQMDDGDLVVVDIGAYIDQYAADVTRTYPVNGTFSKEQAKVYEAVRDTQAYIAEIVGPGYYIYNAEKPEASLYHCAQERLRKHGYKEYFVHNIGHFLGLDVHDVGDINEPLAQGDVITIEPGVYDPDTGIGVRIEDDYWIVNDGSVCLTEGLPSQQDEIERLASRGFSQLDEQEEQSSEADEEVYQA